MARGVADYKLALAALLPRGDAWQFGAGSDFDKLLEACGEEFARIDARIKLQRQELDSRETYELLPEFEVDWSLPDECAGGDQTVVQRRNSLRQKMLNGGGQSRQFFIDLAAELGFEITITEYEARLCGGLCGDASGGDDWNFIWQVNAAAINPQNRTCGNPCGEPFGVWGNDQLECVIRRLVHSHRIVRFSYQ